MAALQELEEWPDLPNVRFGTKLNQNGHTEDWTLRPEQVTGIFEAIYQHAATLLPFGVQAVKALHNQPALTARLAALTSEVSALREAVDIADSALRRMASPGPLPGETRRECAEKTLHLVRHARRDGGK